eukprot:TRINITY_DN11373_c0_g1_i2.p1 TRINITY_DN11373_c0_g1~~TRINITY_DN11373_c0_g1_i2.p1  ORF type:complete len:335 (+),score=82.90 TRINITY_DN11373_c0_g1_i2:154-1158(+)
MSTSSRGSRLTPGFFCASPSAASEGHWSVSSCEGSAGSSAHSSARLLRGGRSLVEEKTVLLKVGPKVIEVLREPLRALHPDSVLSQMIEGQEGAEPIDLEGNPEILQFVLDYEAASSAKYRRGNIPDEVSQEGLQGEVRSLVRADSLAGFASRFMSTPSTTPTGKAGYKDLNDPLEESIARKKAALLADLMAKAGEKKVKKAPGQFEVTLAEIGKRDGQDVIHFLTEGVTAKLLREELKGWAKKHGLVVQVNWTPWTSTVSQISGCVFSKTMAGVAPPGLSGPVGVAMSLPGPSGDKWREGFDVGTMDRGEWISARGFLDKLRHESLRDLTKAP